MRATARPRTRTPPASAPQPEGVVGEVEAVDRSTMRLRQVLDLTAAGRTQVQIAAALNCSDRTVRNLLKEARARQVTTFRARSPEAVLADVESKAASHYARWTALWARARSAGDLRTEALILARMDTALLGRVAMLARVGFFDGVPFANNGATDESTRKATKARADIDALVMLSAALNSGEDMNSVIISRPSDDVATEDAEPLY